MYLSNRAGDYFTGVKVKGGLKGFVRNFSRKDVIFNGFLRNNKKNGHGKVDCQNGAEFSCIWYNGRPHGSGVLQ